MTACLSVSRCTSWMSRSLVVMVLQRPCILRRRSRIGWDAFPYRRRPQFRRELQALAGSLDHAKPEARGLRRVGQAEVPRTIDIHDQCAEDPKIRHEVTSARQLALSSIPQATDEHYHARCTGEHDTQLLPDLAYAPAIASQ